MSTLRTHRRRAVLGSFIGTTIEWLSLIHI